MVGRLKPGITAAQAETDAERVAQETMRNYPALCRVCTSSDSALAA